MCWLVSCRGRSWQSLWYFLSRTSSSHVKKILSAKTSHTQPSRKHQTMEILWKVQTKLLMVYLCFVKMHILNYGLQLWNNLSSICWESLVFLFLFSKFLSCSFEKNYFCMDNNSLLMAGTISLTQLMQLFICMHWNVKPLRGMSFNVYYKPGEKNFPGHWH